MKCRVVSIRGKPGDCIQECAVCAQVRMCSETWGPESGIMILEMCVLHCENVRVKPRLQTAKWINKTNTFDITCSVMIVLPQQNRLSAFHEILQTQDDTSKPPHTTLKKEKPWGGAENLTHVFMYSMEWGGVFDLPLSRLSLIFARKADTLFYYGNMCAVVLYCTYCLFNICIPDFDSISN